MAWPSSRAARARPATPPRVRPRSRRASASSWRTVPTRQGTHCPQDSSRKNAAMRQQQAAELDGVVDGQHDARAEGGAERARVPSKVSGMSSSSGRDEAAGRAAQQHGLQVRPPRPAGQLEQLAQRDRRTAPRRRPGGPTAPETQKSLGPVDLSVPMRAKAGPPSSTIGRTLTSVSTLLTTVGWPNSPSTTGTAACCAARRGSPRSSRRPRSPRRRCRRRRRVRSSMSKREALAEDVRRRGSRARGPARWRCSMRVGARAGTRRGRRGSPARSRWRRRRWSSPRRRRTDRPP